MKCPHCSEEINLLDECKKTQKEIRLIMEMQKRLGLSNDVKQAILKMQKLLHKITEIKKLAEEE